MLLAQILINEVFIEAKNAFSSRHRDGNTTTAIYWNAAAVDYERSLRPGKVSLTNYLCLTVEIKAAEVKCGCIIYYNNQPTKVFCSLRSILEYQCDTSYASV